MTFMVNRTFNIDDWAIEDMASEAYGVVVSTIEANLEEELLDQIDLELSELDENIRCKLITTIIDKTIKRLNNYVNENCNL